MISELNQDRETTRAKMKEFISSLDEMKKKMNMDSTRPLNPLRPWKTLKSPSKIPVYQPGSLLELDPQIPPKLRGQGLPKILMKPFFHYNICRQPPEGIVTPGKAVF